MATSKQTTKDVERNFGAWLDVTLSNKRLRGRDVARAIGVHDSAVSRWRAGRGVPTMSVCTRLAEFLKVDPLRLAVTAGHIPSEIAGADPLPMPQPTAARESVRQQLRAIKGLSDGSRDRLIETYERLITEEEPRNA